MNTYVFHQKRARLPFYFHTHKKCVAGLFLSPMSALPYEENGEAFGAVSAEDEDALDIAGAAGAGNEGYDAGIIIGKFLLNCF